MRLPEARARHRVTQWDLKMKTGIHQSRVSLIERGYIDPSPDEKAKIAEALGLGVSDIQWNEVF